LQLMPLFRTNGNISERSKSSGNTINYFVWIGHHVIDGLPTSNNFLPSIFSQLDLFVVSDDIV